MLVGYLRVFTECQAHVENEIEIASHLLLVQGALYK